jgi:hypothetical protein
LSWILVFHDFCDNILLWLMALLNILVQKARLWVTPGRC